jgi:predicted ATPase
MRLLSFRAEHYLSLHDVSLEFDALNLFIGANASGKSNILNALRFLAEGLGRGDFEQPVADRGGILHLAWKGEDASRILLETRFQNEDRTFSWRLSFGRSQYSFTVNEELFEETSSGDVRLLDSKGGKGTWRSDDANKYIPLELPPTACALAAAAPDASFRARGVAQFVRGWGFFDPSASQLRRASAVADTERLDLTGRNLAGRLYGLKQRDQQTFSRIVDATRAVLGVPDEIQFRVSEEDGRVYFVQREMGLKFLVHQIGASSGTLRMLALMTALFGEAGYGLVGIEEPENHVHPAALAAFAQYLKEASGSVQVLVTTHSPLLLDHLNAPEAICVVRRGDGGTEVERETNPEAVRSALTESGFGLGEFYETKGFGQ